MYVVRLYGYDEASERETLLEERKFTSEADARQFTRQAARAGDALVTFNGPEVGRFAVLAPERGWLWTYSGITRDEAQDIADALTHGSGDTWIVERAA